MSGVSSSALARLLSAVLSARHEEALKRIVTSLTILRFFRRRSCHAAEGLETKVFGKGRKVMATRKAMRPRIPQVMYMVA